MSAKHVIEQYDLYSGEPPHQKHSPTSREAAKAVVISINRLHRRLLGFLATRPAGATDEEMQDALSMGANTQRPRRRELQLSRHVEDSGHTKLTRSGHRAVLWRLTQGTTT